MFAAKSITKPKSSFSTNKANTPFIQPKLSIGKPNDKYEKEADSVHASCYSTVYHLHGRDDGPAPP